MVERLRALVSVYAGESDKDSEAQCWLELRELDTRSLEG